MKNRFITKAVFVFTALALIVSLVCALDISLSAAQDTSDTVLVPGNSKPLRLWYDEETPYGNEDLSWYYKNNNPTGIAYSYNENDGWERWSKADLYAYDSYTLFRHEKIGGYIICK